MTTFRFVTSLAAVTVFAGLAACGGDDGGGGGGIDAAVSIDAPNGTVDAAIDAPNSVPGLGMTCNPQANPSMCPAGAPICLTFNGTTGFCSLVCASQQMNQPNAMGQFPRPPAGDPACQAAFSGAAGMPLCGVILSNTLQPPIPQGGQPMAGTTYTYDAACAVVCGAGNTCPSNLTCDTARGLCLP
ncbi:MAG: hypothetical protein R3B06_02650 [Kofleriaceae bacterium]